MFFGSSAPTAGGCYNAPAAIRRSPVDTRRRREPDFLHVASAHRPGRRPDRLGDAAALGQNAPANTDWRSYGGNLANHRYAPLDQINASNFKNLEIAWRFKTENLGPRQEFQFESTPLIVNGVMYSTAGTRRAVVAIDAATGELLWMHSENEGPRGQNAPRLLSGRGLAYWTDGREERILYVTPGYRLVALDAKTGAKIPGFGKDGVVDLKMDNDQDIDLVTGEVGLHATPMIGNDVVVIGAAHRPGGVPRGKTNVKGFIRGFDVRTGKRLWIFHTIPNLGEFGNDTWEKDSWKYTGNTGVWGQVAIDEELNMAYLPIELPPATTTAARVRARTCSARRWSRST